MSKPSSYAVTLYDHVRELQFRLLASVAVLLVGGVVGYFLYNPIFQLLRSPLHAPLYYSSPAGSFLFVMKISLLVAVATALPVIIYNLIMFIRPAFKENLSRTRVYLTTLGSIILAALGALFAFIIILPASIKFFVGFQVTGLSALLDAGTYLSFVINILISFILVFQLPLVISFIDHIKPIPPKKLLKLEKWVIIGAILIGVLAPFSFDPTTELLIAAPIIILFNLSILMIALQHAYKNRLIKKAARKKSQQALKAHKKAKAAEQAPLLPKPQVIAAQAMSVKQAPSVLENSFIEDGIEVETPAPVQKTAESTPIKIAPHAPQAKKWMDVAPTAVNRPAKLAPAPARPQQPVAIPQRKMDYSERRFISDML